MTKKINDYSRKYEGEFGKLVYGKLANNFNKIHGDYGDPFLVRGSPEDLLILERNFNIRKEVIKIHSKDPEATQLQLERITGTGFSQYRVY